MIFIVAGTYMHATQVARSQGLTSPSQMTWLHGSTMHKIRGIERPTVWVCPHGRDSLSDADRELIESRRPLLVGVTCE